MRIRVGTEIALVALCGALAMGQEKCPLPPSPFANEPNIFSPQQEMYLGEISADHLERNFRVIQDVALTEPLQRVGERLLRGLPAGGLEYRFQLFDLPEANAFSMAGGRVYVSRKMVAFAKDEEELAALLAHEIGHVYTHQQAIDYTRWFHDALGVTQVGDRNDVFRRYNELLDNLRRKPATHGEKREEREQNLADEIAIYAMARAGYNPQAFAAFWDRFAETHGKTGGFFSDLFGATTSESRRLREILKNTAAMPAGCVEPRATANEFNFRAWQSNVIAYSAPEPRQAIAGAIEQVQFDPPLESSLNYLRFSPDGKYLLAQDDSGIDVLTASPPAFLFRIRAEEAQPAQFTPDAKHVVFLTSGLRVEIWDIAAQKQTQAHEIVQRKSCLQATVAPDGETVACYGTEFGLSLIDAGTSKSFFEKKEFLRPDLFQFLIMMITELARAADQEDEDTVPQLHFLSMHFSPDGRYFAAGAQQTALAYDLGARRPISLSGDMRHWLEEGFDFVSASAVVGLGGLHGESSAIVTFPEGKTLHKLVLGRQDVNGASDPKYILLRPIDKLPVGIMDVTTGKLVMGNHRPAVDIFNGTFVSEARDGEIAFSQLKQGSNSTELLGRVALPKAPLGRLRATAVSDDMQWVALSQKDRGAVFDLHSGKQASLVRGFRGAWFDANDTAYADFPKFEKADRGIVRLDPTHRQDPNALRTLDEELQARQYGRYFVERMPDKKGAPATENFTLRVSDVGSGAALWSRHFGHNVPRIFIDSSCGTASLLWNEEQEPARDMIEHDSGLRAKADAMHGRSGVDLIEVLDANSGSKLGLLLFDTGKSSFRVRDVSATADFVALSVSSNRVLEFSLKSGTPIGSVFGGPAQLSKSGALAVMAEDGFELYDAGSLAKLQRYQPGDVALLHFSPDGKQLLAITKDQRGFIFEVGDAQAAMKH